MFRQGKAVRRPSRVPYLKRGLQVEGLPENIEFKKPYCYGSVQLKKIMLTQNEIKFKLDKEDSSKNVQGEPSSSPSPEVTNDAGSVKELLVKIAGVSDAKGALSMTVPKKIEEVDIEVINLNLTQEERVVLSPVVNNI